MVRAKNTVSTMMLSAINMGMCNRSCAASILMTSTDYCTMVRLGIHSVLWRRQLVHWRRHFLGYARDEVDSIGWLCESIGLSGCSVVANAVFGSLEIVLIR